MKEAPDRPSPSEETAAGADDDRDLPWAEILPDTEVDAETATEAGVPCFRFVGWSSDSPDTATAASDEPVRRALADWDREWEAARSDERVETFAASPTIVVIEDPSGPPPLPAIIFAVILIALAL